MLLFEKLLPREAVLAVDVSIEAPVPVRDALKWNRLLTHPCRNGPFNLTHQCRNGPFVTSI